MTINRCTKSAVFNADDEEPKCLNCDNVNTGLCKNCGSGNCWRYYLRSVPLREMLKKWIERGKECYQQKKQEI